MALHLGVLLAVGLGAPEAASSIPITAGAWRGSVFEVGMAPGPASEAPGDRSGEAPGASLSNARERGADSDVNSRRAQEVPSGGEAGPEGTVPRGTSLGSGERRVVARELSGGRVGGKSSGPAAGAAQPEGGPAAKPDAGGAVATGLGGDTASSKVGQLPAAFTRALPAAARGDRTWHTLGPGPAGRAVVRARLDAGGTLSALELEMDAPPPQLVRLLRVTRVLLQGGRFALPQGATGEHRLGLEVWLEDADGVEGGEAYHVRQLASTHPTPSEPGEALVVFNSGRRVRLRVFLEPNW